MKNILTCLLVIFAFKAFPQQIISANSGSVANCLCSGDLWNISNPLKPSVTFSAAGYTHRILFTNYNFNIPTTATVTGYEVSFSYTSNISIQNVRDSIVALLVNGYVAGYSQETLTPTYVGNNTVVIGSPTNIWGVWLGSNEINAPNFGFNFKLVSNTAGIKFGFVNGVTITIYYMVTSGIRESQSMTSNTKLYTDKKNVIIRSELSENSEVSIYNITGNKLMNFNLEANSKKNLDLSDLSHGIYLYTIKSGKEEMSGKFILN